MSRDEWRRWLMGVFLGAALLLIIVGSIISVQWVGTLQEFTNQQLGNAIFESWGPTLIIVGLLMFASMLGGVYIAQEDK